MTSLPEFEKRASQKSELKPFKLIKNERGTRIWESENGLRIKATKIGSREYYEVSIIMGEKLGDININGEKLVAKDVQKEISELGAKYNFNYIKRQVASIRKSETGHNLRRDWELLIKKLTKRI